MAKQRVSSNGKKSEDVKVEEVKAEVEEEEEEEDPELEEEDPELEEEEPEEEEEQEVEEEIEEDEEEMEEEEEEEEVEEVELEDEEEEVQEVAEVKREEEDVVIKDRVKDEEEEEEEDEEEEEEDEEEQEEEEEEEEVEELDEVKREDEIEVKIEEVKEEDDEDEGEEEEEEEEEDEEEDVEEVEEDTKEQAEKEFNPAESSVIESTLEQFKQKVNEDEDEDPDEDEEPCEEESNEEEEEEDADEEEQCEDAEMDEEEPSEGSEEEPSEEDPREARREDSGKRQLNATASNTDKRQTDSTISKVTSQLEPSARTSNTVIQEMPQAVDMNDILPEKQKTTETARKKRQSRWDTIPGAEGEGADANGEVTKKRKTRWSTDDPQLNIPGHSNLLDILKVPVTQADPVTHELNVQLQEITQKLLAREIRDDRPENERSPSPPPIYNELGFQINTREVRLRAKLIDQRRKILSDLMKKTAARKQVKEQKFIKKLFIPVKEYPDYNFVGLILGPRGVTQKRMEKATGARLFLRGKGSQKKGMPSDDNSQDEDLHVLIEADTQNSLDEAVAMVEKLLIPVEDEKNEHKSAQLRELAEMNGTLKYTTKKVPCGVCGDENHLTTACPLTASTPETSSGLQVSSALGGGLFSSMRPPTVSTVALLANQSAGTLPTFKTRELDEANVYIGFLPPSVDDNRLIEMFLPFGQISEAKVVRDRVTGIPRGYAFVRYVNVACAAEAIARMNGMVIDGHMLAVRVAGRPPTIPTTPPVPIASGAWVGQTAVPQNFAHMANYPGPAAYYNTGGTVSPVFAHQPSYPAPASMLGPAGWPGPAGSVLPNPYASFSSSSVLPSHMDPLSGQTSASYYAASATTISSDDLANFPGFVKSFDPVDAQR